MSSMPGWPTEQKDKQVLEDAHTGHADSDGGVGLSTVLELAAELQAAGAASNQESPVNPQLTTNDEEAGNKDSSTATAVDEMTAIFVSLGQGDQASQEFETKHYSMTSTPILKYKLHLFAETSLELLVEKDAEKQVAVIDKLRRISTEILEECQESVTFEFRRASAPLDESLLPDESGVLSR
ncbi:MAG: hypothetical protein Q9181_007870 [Wetmoreana brouardii]